ncbi:MAG TPA: MFS transporter, partial [Planctomycetota bacterium]|nr:MFS transporter [Planctomycetota bacterium]
MAEAPAPISRRYMGYALGICFCANFLNYLDRFIISALLPEIKKDLQMGDDLAGALVTAFTIGYMLAAPLVGVLSDRYSRPKLFAACILIWS